MFREVRRANRRLPEAEAREILRTAMRGVLSTAGEDGWPYGMPMNHWYCEEDGCLYFHTGKGGHREEILREHPRVSFCARDDGEHRGDG